MKETCMDLATDVYLSRTNHCPCSDTVINLYEGADSSQKQEERKLLLQFLKGSKQQQIVLKRQHPTLYQKFEQVWQLRKAHMVNGLPPQ